MAERSVVERARDRGKQFVREDRYVLVLVLIVASILSTAFVGDGVLGLLLTLGLMSLTLSVTLSTSEAGPKTQSAVRAAIVIAFSLVLLSYLANLGGLARAGFFITTITLSVVTPIVIARRLWKHPSVSAGTVAGAADIYLLLGLLFAVVYSLIGAVQAGMLNTVFATTAIDITPHAAFFIAGRPTVPSDFVYFSFATLTTVGYGDLTATSALGRLLSNTEALAGQLYLVTVVAVLVSNLGRARATSLDDAE
jgi:hypothetical protein